MNRLQNERIKWSHFIAFYVTLNIIRLYLSGTHVKGHLVCIIDHNWCIGALQMLSLKDCISRIHSHHRNHLHHPTLHQNPQFHQNIFLRPSRCNGQRSKTGPVLSQHCRSKAPPLQCTVSITLYSMSRCFSLTLIDITLSSSAVSWKVKVTFKNGLQHQSC